MTDRLSALPSEVILYILSFLTLKEVVKTSVCSKKWRRFLLGYYPKLYFEDSRTMKKMYWNKKKAEVIKERASFVNRTEDAMKQHLDSSIDEFRVTFDLDDCWHSHVDNWVAFALTKRAKNLVLNFRPCLARLNEKHCRVNFKPLGVNCALTSLTLNFVNLTSEAVQIILVSCPFLENLIIEESESLTSIISPASSLSLKHLDVSRCQQLEAIDISAPKLVFLRYFGKPIELNIKNASSLSSVSNGRLGGKCRAFAFRSLSKYFPQLKALYLGVFSNSIEEHKIGAELLQLPLFFTKLKVLELSVCGPHTGTIFGWATLIEACPILEKLTLKFDGHDVGVNNPIIAKSNESVPLKRLKTLELLGYCGRHVDLEIAIFILENAIMLQEVIVEITTYTYDVKQNEPIRISELKRRVPNGASFTATESSYGSFRANLI